MVYRSCVEAGFYISNWALLTASAGQILNDEIRTLSKDPTYTGRLEFYPKIGKIGLLFGGSYAAAKIPQQQIFMGFYRFWL